MIALLFLLGILAIVGIARYNEDDRLFWKLFICYSVAFAATSIAVATFDGGQDENNSTEQVYPTQVLDSTTNLLGLYAIACEPATVSESFAPVSKDNALFNNGVVELTEVCGNVRDQPPIVVNLAGFITGPPAFTIDSS